MHKKNKHVSLALLLTRVGVGTIFVAHGLSKLQGGVGNFAGLLGDQLGFPLPDFFAWMVTLAELFGGIALILGVATPIFAGILAIVILVAILTMKAKTGLIAAGGGGAQLDIALFVGLLSLVLQGGGGYSIDHKYKWCNWFGCTGCMMCGGKMSCPCGKDNCDCKEKMAQKKVDHANHKQEHKDHSHEGHNEKKSHEDHKDHDHGGHKDNN